MKSKYHFLCFCFGTRYVYSNPILGIAVVGMVDKVISFYQFYHLFFWTFYGYVCKVVDVEVAEDVPTDFALFPNPTDTLTLIPFFKSFLQRYGNLPSVAVADSGYGSEENYRFMDEAGMEAYVKYNRFHIEQRPRHRPNPFHQDNFHYNVLCL